METSVREQTRNIRVTTNPFAVTKLLDGRTDRIQNKSSGEIFENEEGATKVVEGLTPTTHVTKKNIQVVPIGGSISEKFNANDEVARARTLAQETGLVSTLTRELAARKSVGESRWSLSNDKLAVMKCKVAILQSLFFVADIRAHYRLSQLLHSIVSSAARGVSVLTASGGISNALFKDFEHLFESDDGRALDVGTMCEGPIDTICMDLMIYESDELFESALSFMRRR